ncbi:unnamed protein product, partial [Brassica rapa subsp. trilocularis]
DLQVRCPTKKKKYNKELANLYFKNTLKVCCCDLTTSKITTLASARLVHK